MSSGVNFPWWGRAPHALEARAVNQLARHKAKRIAAWAQINGSPRKTDTPEKIHKRVEHDLFYIDHWSVGFDLYTLLRTPLALLSAKNAY
jgi:lipopolysaccharide/colanic/teichoic acid biosynthesis glycosyltransferase